MDKNIGFKVERFEHLSSGLLHQIESGVCESDRHQPNENFSNEKGKMTMFFLVLSFLIKYFV